MFSALRIYLKQVNVCGVRESQESDHWGQTDLVGYPMRFSNYS